MIDELLSPLAEETIERFRALPASSLGTYTTFFSGNMPKLKKFKLAIVGVQEDRGALVNKGCSEGPDQLREHFYELVVPDGLPPIIDLGNIAPGNSSQDTDFALSTVVYELLKQNVIPLIIGGSHDLTYAQYRAYEHLNKPVNAIVVDERIDLAEANGEWTDTNFLTRLLTHEPNFLMNLGLLGYQSYFTPQKATDTLDKLNFDCVRLGWLRDKLSESEPLIRDADLMSVDITAIKQADAPAHAQASPNGLYGEEICQLLRYAGMSDRMSSLGLYGLNPSYDNYGQSSQLVAQMLWYFVEGVTARRGEYPFKPGRKYMKYHVDLHEGAEQIVFWKSLLTGRWWMEVPVDDTTHYVPCAYAVYEEAMRDELPDQWLKAMERLNAFGVQPEA